MTYGLSGLIRPSTSEPQIECSAGVERCINTLQIPDPKTVGKLLPNFGSNEFESCLCCHLVKLKLYSMFVCVCSCLFSCFLVLLTNVFWGLAEMILRPVFLLSDQSVGNH